MRIGRSIDAAISTHEGKADPHPTYETGTEVDTRITTHKEDASAHHAKYTDAEAVTANAMDRIVDSLIFG